MSIRKILLLIISCMFLAGSNIFPQEIIEASIGVKINRAGKDRIAKSHDRLIQFDLLQIFVLPYQDSYLYIVESDEESANLIYSGGLEKDSVKILPSESEYYAAAGKSRFENFSILILPGEDASLELKLTNNPLSADEWKLIEEKMIEESKYIETDKPDDTISIGGNVRSSIYPFLKEYKGKLTLIKTYKFDVKK